MDMIINLINDYCNNIFFGGLFVFIAGWLVAKFMPLMLVGKLLEYVDDKYVDKLQPELKKKWQEQYDTLIATIDKMKD